MCSVVTVMDASALFNDGIARWPGTMHVVAQIDLHNIAHFRIKSASSKLRSVAYLARVAELILLLLSSSLLFYLFFLLPVFLLPVFLLPVNCIFC